MAKKKGDRGEERGTDESRRKFLKAAAAGGIAVTALGLMSTQAAAAEGGVTSGSPPTSDSPYINTPLDTMVTITLSDQQKSDLATILGHPSPSVVKIYCKDGDWQNTWGLAANPGNVLN